MQISLRRSQKTGMMGKSQYFLAVRANLTSEEKDIINKNRLGKEVLVYHEKTGEAESLTGAIMKSMKDTVLTVESFHNGVTFTCNNVAELLGIEDEVRNAALNLRAYIEVARHFGGEEVVNVDDELEKIMRAKQR